MSDAPTPESARSTDVQAVERTENATQPYAKPAGGLGAVISSFKEQSRHVGLVAGTRLLLKLNQDDGFDCPGCAWPDPPPGERTRFEFCENGAKAVAAEATRRRVDAAFFAQWNIPDLLKKSDHWLEAQGRLTQPMYRAKGSDAYTPIDWDAAFALIGARLNGLASPDEAIFYTSGRTSNEAAFLYQLFARRFGTNNMPDCSNMCHESSGRGLGATIGVGKGTVGLHDFDAAEAIFIIGQNPGTNHPRMLTTLETAARRGCKIVSINPLRERALERFSQPQHPLALLGKSTVISTLYLQVMVNGDVALMTGIAKHLYALDTPSTPVLDLNFIATHTEGHTAFRASVEAVSWDAIEAGSGVPREEIEAAAEIYAESNATIICWAMGLTQHANGVDNIKMAVNLLLMKGNLGKPGAGACPVRGHSNVQGDRTMGIVERPKAAFLDKLGARFDFEPPRAHGHDVVEAIHAMHRGDAKVFVAMGGNFHSATPDTDYTAAALRRCALTVQISTKLNRSHLVTGEEALILPCLGRTERDAQASGPQFVTVENSMSVVHRSTGRRDPASGALRSEPAIVAGMATATLGDGTWWTGRIEDYDRIRDDIEAVIPGFDDYNKRVRAPGGFLLPNGPRERRWTTPSGKAHFSVTPLPVHDLAPGQMLMITVRSHDQYNTTIYGLDDRYRGIYGERRVVMMHPDDIAAGGLTEGQVVDLTSHFEGETRVAPRFIVMRQSLPRRCVATYFPEANVLIPARHTARISNTPASKSVVVTVQPTTTPA